jgi:hypothetical protein
VWCVGNLPSFAVQSGPFIPKVDRLKELSDERTTALVKSVDMWKQGRIDTKSGICQR